MISHNWSPMKRLIWLRGSGITGGAGTYETVTGNPVSFTALRSAPLKSLKVALSPIQVGSGDPSPDNIRPISGWDSLHVYDDPLYAGVIEWNQLFNYVGVSPSQAQGVTCINNNDGTFTCDGVSTSRVYKLLVTLATIVGHKYYLGGCPSGGDTTKYLMNIDAETGSVDTGSGAIFTSTRASSQFYIVIGKDYPVSNLVFTPQLCDLTEMFGAGNEPATVEEFKALFPHDYYPYNAGTETLVGTVNGMDTRSISITIGQTVYSGTVDVVTGVLTVDMVMQDMGTLGWVYNTNAKCFTVGTAGGLSAFANGQSATEGCLAFCSNYKRLKSGTGSSFSNNDKCYSFNKNASGGGINGNAGATLLLVKDTAYDNKDTFKAAMSGVQMCYELATPIPFQLTPQEVQSLAGDNVIFSDANGNLTVEYRSN